MWKPLIAKRSSSAANKLRAAQTACYARPPSKGGLDGRPYRVAESVFSGLRPALVLLAALVVSVSAASSQNPSAREARRRSTRRRTARGSRGVAGNFCTIRSSNVKALKVGSKIFYLQAGGKTALNSDTAIYVGPGNIAAGHCLLHFATGVGLCTISDGTGTLAGFHARVRVTADSSISELWHWDGTYSFSNG